ncbi:hypothetical protein [Borreliella carolinensis]|uniref:Uncharacterized protein n=1 Tax=Borreliella carolinensis TaxID=478174 RepID=A0ACD5GKE4_9SPIR
MNKLSIFIILLVFSCNFHQDIPSSISDMKEETPESQTDEYSSYNRYLNYNSYSIYRRTPRITRYRHRYRRYY